MKIVYALAAVLMMAVLADAGLGVARDNLPNNIITLQPGESAWYGMRIQNTEDERVTVNVRLEGAEGIATIPKNIYIVPARTYDTEVRLNITAPYDAPLGKTYPIRISLNPAPSAGTSQIGLSGGVSFNITLKIGLSDEKSTLIIRRDIKDQTYPCVQDGDCPGGLVCSNRSCAPAPPVVEEEGYDYIGLAFYPLVILFLAFLAYLFGERLGYRGYKYRRWVDEKWYGLEDGIREISRGRTR